MKKSQANRKLFLLMAATLFIFLAVAVAAPQSVNGQPSDPMGRPMTVDATQAPAATLAPVADTTQYPLTQPDQMGQMGGSVMGSGSMDMVILVGLIVAVFWLIRRLAPVKTSQSS